MNANHSKAKLEKFFKEVARLTSHHGNWHGRAVVYPRDLGAALETVDRKWYRGIPPEKEEPK